MTATLRATKGGDARVFNFLPAVDRVPLGGAPLQQVIAQVKFNTQSALATHQGAGVLYDALSDQYQRMLAEQQAMITAGPGGVTTQQVPQWRLTDLEGVWSVIAGPEVMAIETVAYASWEALRERLRQALDALDVAAGPRVRERIGLRYVNHIAAGEDGSFAGRIRPELLGLAGEPGWREALSASLSQTVLRDGDTQMALRYGAGAQVVPGNVFVLDIDCSDEQPVEFDADDVLAYFDTLNDAAYRCFCNCVPAPYRATLVDQGAP